MSKRGIPAWWPRWRRFKDRATTAAIATGGSVVLLTIVLLFFFLVYEVTPLLREASATPMAPLEWPVSDSRWLSLDDYGDVAFQVSSDGTVGFTRLEDAKVLSRRELAPSKAALTTVAGEGAGSGALMLGFSDGSSRVIEPSYHYELTAPERRIQPVLGHPLGDLLLAGSKPVALSAVALDLHAGWLARQYADGQLELQRLGESVAERIDLGSQAPAKHLFLMDAGRWLVLLTEAGDYRVWPLSEGVIAEPVQGRLFADSDRLEAASVLQGGLSLIAASSAGHLNRYYVLQHGAVALGQRFDSGGARLHRLLPEPRRRGFLGFGDGVVQWHNAISGQRGLTADFGITSGAVLALSPRADLLVALDEAGALRRWSLDNPHPEVSLRSLWQEVWYEGYEAPALVYQSSASSNDYEPKFSLTPLAFGTLKAAFYAMVFAAPLAICGAIYTAFFMSPALRRRVKPLVELMEALPTVILGFLAGLWLAPLVEDHLADLITVLLVLPGGVLVFSLCWALLPASWRERMPAGWHAVVLLPVLLALVWLGLELGGSVESVLFDGDARRWFAQELGLAYDQRNAIVVGIAMGFAVIPTIFSIAEDAIYSVPRHLADGSLALGATPWQTLTGVVLPTASPGVFSALMIGFGRALGETMIVLMATGNTPIMEFNPFEGLRSLAANIAVEVPEAEVQSTHYRILFLAAFVLFLFTFVLNSLAELVRQRLRSRYGTL
ncbi:MAG: ABC transporter permease subunit [Pseudomonadota bacterium]